MKNEPNMGYVLGSLEEVSFEFLNMANAKKSKGKRMDKASETEKWRDSILIAENIRLCRNWSESIGTVRFLNLQNEF